MTSGIKAETKWNPSGIEAKSKWGATSSKKIEKARWRCCLSTCSMCHENARLGCVTTSNTSLCGGDAAHILSPIGGQGLNLGWINAQDLIQSLLLEENLKSYEKRSKKRARQCHTKAKFNMAMGRSHQFSLIYHLLLTFITTSPTKKFFRRSFSMTNFLK